MVCCTPPLSLYVNMDSIPANLGIFRSGLDTIFFQLFVQEMNSDPGSMGQEFVDAFFRYGFEVIWRGPNNDPSAVLLLASDGGSLHHDHLHSGNLWLRNAPI